MEKMRTCTKCKTKYPATAKYFSSDKRRPDRLSSWCRKCCLENNKKWSKTEKGKISRRKENAKYRKTKKGKHTFMKSALKCRYNITLDQYDEIFEQQNGVCAICGEPEIKKRLSVDHDHKTGKIRGLLCQRCNFNLGIYEKWKDEFEKYLGRSRLWQRKN